MSTPRKRTNPKLASARAYWRLAWKARRAGNWKQGESFQKAGDRLYDQYRREEDRKAERQAAEAKYWKKVKGQS
jgi:hypothetical protein